MYGTKTLYSEFLKAHRFRVPTKLKLKLFTKHNTQVELFSKFCYCVRCSIFACPMSWRIFLVVAIAYGVYRRHYDDNTGKDNDSANAPRPVVKGTWDNSDTNFIKRVVKSRIPAVFKRDLLAYPHPATRWTPLRLWNPFVLWVKAYKDHTTLPNIRVSRGHSETFEGLEGHVFKLATNRSGPLFDWVLKNESIGYNDSEGMAMHNVLDECCNFQLNKKSTVNSCRNREQSSFSTNTSKSDAQSSIGSEVPFRKRHLYFTSRVDLLGSLDSTLVGLRTVEQTFHVVCLKVFYSKQIYTQSYKINILTLY